MNIGALIQFALMFMKLANWVAAKVDQRQWKASGFQEAALKYSQQFQEITGAAEQAFQDAKKLTPEERRRILEGE